MTHAIAAYMFSLYAHKVLSMRHHDMLAVFLQVHRRTVQL